MARNHKPRKRHIPKRLDMDPMGTAHALASLLLPHQRRALVDPMRSSFERLRAGRGGWPDWCNLADALNVAERLAEQGIANDRSAEFNAGQAALAALHERQIKSGSWTLRGPEITALDTALDMHDVQLEVCTQGELAGAIRTVQRCVAAALAGNASPDALICTGGLGGTPSTTVDAS